jgi:hypothetical protein
MSNRPPSSIKTQTGEKKPRADASQRESLGEFLLTVGKISKEKLEAEEIFKAVRVKTQRDKTLADLAHRRTVTLFVYFVYGTDALLLILQGLKLIELPVSVVIGLGSLWGIAGLLKLVEAMRGRNGSE